MSKKTIIDTIELDGLDYAPSQTWRNVRLVPLLRKNFSTDLRIGLAELEGGSAVVDLMNGRYYTSYIPHGFIVNWSDGGGCAATVDTCMYRGKEKNSKFTKKFGCQVLKGMTRRLEKSQLRMLPLHMAMESFLSRHFGGPTVHWGEYSKYAKRNGLGFRIEHIWSGEVVPHLEDALRVFEIHDNQVGVLLFVSDVLASATVVPHPSDYRKIHYSLIQDFFGPSILRYAAVAFDVQNTGFQIDEGSVENLKDLRRALEESIDDWSRFYGECDRGLLGCVAEFERQYKLGSFNLYRFITDFLNQEENHIGEVIKRDDGRIEYLKTFRMDKEQTMRARLLQTLARHDWHIGNAAASMGKNIHEMIVYIDQLGFGYLIKEFKIREAKSQL